MCRLKYHPASVRFNIRAFRMMSRFPHAVRKNLIDSPNSMIVIKPEPGGENAVPATSIRNGALYERSELPL
jgi:hypothetical protein